MYNILLLTLWYLNVIIIIPLELLGGGIMIRKKINILIIVVTVLLISLVFTACDKNEPTPSPEPETEKKTVLEAVSMVLESLEQSNFDINTDEVIYIQANAKLEISDGIYDFVLRANIEPTGAKERNDENTVFFEVTKNSSVYVGIYYQEGVLYLNLPVNGGESSEKFYISNLYLSDIMAPLDMEGVSENKVLRNLLASFISSVSYSTEDDVETLVFTLDLKKAFDTIFNFLTAEYDIAYAEDLFQIIGITPDDLDQELEKYSSVNLTVEIDDGVFKKFSYDNNVDTVFSLTAFNVKNGTGVFTIPAKIEDYTEYSPTNVSIKGSLTLDISEGEFITPVGGINISSSFIETEYVFDFEIRSKLNLLSPDDSELLVKLGMPDKWEISIYYRGSDEYIYADLSEINAGQIKMKASALTELINSLAEELSVEDQDQEEPEAPSEGILSGDVSSIFALLGLMAPGISLDTDSIEIDFDSERFREFFAAFGIDLPLDIDNLGIVVERDNYDFNSIYAHLRIGGMELILDADDISVGPAPIIPVPAGLAGYTDAEDVEVFSVMMQGSLDLVTAQPDLLTLIEGTLSNITGEEIELDLSFNPAGTEIKYDAKLGFSAADGTLDLIEVYLYDVNSRFIVGLTYLESNGKIHLIEQSQQGAFYYTEYDFGFEYAEMVKLITGITNYEPSDEEERIGLTNTLTSFNFIFNYKAFYTISEYIRATFFNNTEELAKEFVFDEISFTIGDSFIGSVAFSGGKSVTFSADSLHISYTPVTITGVVEPTSKNVSSIYQDNNMPDSLTLEFSDGSERLFKVSGWSYDLSALTSNGGTVIATTYILGYRIDYSITFPKPTISFTGLEAFSQGMSFNKNDLSVNVIEHILSYDTITIGSEGNSIVKEVFWDLEELEGEDENGVYQIQAYIYDYFGRIKKLPGDDIYFDIEITGTDISSHTLDREFEAYGGIDPGNLDNYPDLAILTSEGVITVQPDAVGDLINLEWDLTAITDAYSLAGFNAYEEGLEVTVTVNVPNSLNAPRTFNVNVKINPAVMDSISFEGAKLNNGKSLDDGLNKESTATGVYWDGEWLVMNPLIIREINEAVLPASVEMLTEDGKSFDFYGLKWEFMPLEINNSGAEYDDQVNLIIGDAIGGYQSTKIKLKVLEMEINNFQILNSSEDEIPSLDIGALYKKYEINNPYGYDMPEKTRISTAGYGEIVLSTDWTIPGFDIAALYNGGTYEGKYQAGSQELKLQIVVKPAIAEMNDIEFENTDTITYDSDAGLVFNPYTSADFTDVGIYPSRGLASFSDGQGNITKIEVPLRWDISAITSLYSGSNPDMYKGKICAVKAYTDYDKCGSQLFYVQVYIEEALLDIENTVISEANQTKTLDLCIFGSEDGKLTFTDPRIQESYPEQIYVAYEGGTLDNRIIEMQPENVDVLSWDISAVLDAYTQVNIISGISGEYPIIATIGTERGGYQTVEMTVNITSASLDNVEFKAIPLLSDGTPAFNYDSKEDENYIATFTFNPYDTDVKNGISYAAKIAYELEIDSTVYEFEDNIEWNLASLNGITPYLGGEYIVEARLPLSDTGYIPINVRVIINEKIINALNIGGLNNIFIDPLEDTPFGRRNSEEYVVSQPVEVTFTGYDEVKSLYLTYSRENILIDFGGEIYDVTAYVGNEYGGYQPVGDNGQIKLAIIQRIITKVTTEDDEEIYRREVTEISEDVYEIEHITSTLYYESRPDTLKFYFTGLNEPVSVPIRDENTTGLCYDWVDTGEFSAEITIFNIIPQFFEGDEDTVFTNNPCVPLDVKKLIDVNDVDFYEEGVYEAHYRGEKIDIYDELKGAGVIKNLSLGIPDDCLEVEYYYEDALITADDIINSGVYTMRVYVKRHTVYGGYADINYEILKNDISSVVVIKRNGITLNNPGINNDVIDEIEFSGASVVYEVNAGEFMYEFTLVYPDGEAPVNVGEYLILIQVDEETEFAKNVYCTNTITLTITKVYLDETSDGVAINYDLSIPYGTDELNIELLCYDEQITDFEFGFYMDAAHTVPIEDIGVLEVGAYFIYIEYTGLNFDIRALKSFNVIPAEIQASDIIFSAANMQEGESGPALTLKLFGSDIPEDLLDATVTYYLADGITPLAGNISEAAPGKYYVKIRYEKPNYLAIEPMIEFFIIQG
jgi:hypothetical protein